MGIQKSVKIALVLLQVGILASAFFFFFGWVAAILYVLGEVSVAEILDYLLVMASMEGFGFMVFLEGLAYYTFKKNRKVRKK